MQASSGLDALARLPGEPARLSAAGVTRSGARLQTIENLSPFANGARARLVIVADDERAAKATIDALRWFKTDGPRALRDRWEVSAVFIGYANDATPAQRLEFPPVKGFFDHPEQPESRYVWRWAIYQAPDVLLQIRGGDVLSVATAPARSIAAAIAGGSEIGTAHAVFGTARETDGVALLQSVLKGSARVPRSEIRMTIMSRAAREPLAIARILAPIYPQGALVSYIPSVAWANTLRLAEATKDAGLRQKVIDQTRPWVSGERPLFGDRISLTAVAGTLIYAELAARGMDAAVPLAIRGAEEASRVAEAGYAQHGQGWTDDMFMMAAILARTGRMAGRAKDLDHLAAMLISYVRRLQRQDGIFVHFTDGQIPWGRGNGFAILGLAEALDAIPARHPSREQLLEAYRRYMNTVPSMQAPDGMWRQVVDEPGAYREESVTAMTLAAMARGIRLGWLDRKTFRPIADRAWRALAAHISGDGSIVDICASTGSQPNVRRYLDRPAISGFDDRGGAMALLAAMEMYELARAV